MAIAASFPTIRPSLLLDFANSGVLDPRITFSRSTTATYYDGVTTAKAEENLFRFSTFPDPTGSSWLDDSITRTYGQTGPDGSTNALLLDEGSATAAHQLRTSTGNLLTIPANTNFTVSFFVEDVNTQYVAIAVYGAFNNYQTVEFDLTAGTVNRNAGANITLVSSNITSVIGNWYRCVLTYNTADTTTKSVRIGFSDGVSSLAINTGNLPSIAGTGRTFYLFGPQAEIRSSVTAYTPTTTQPITNYIPVLLTAPANTARFDHNPTTGEALGLLIEEQRTNLLTYSEQIGNLSVWIPANSSVVSDTIVAPNGALTGDLYVPKAPGTVGARRIAQTVAMTSSTTYNVSFYLKSGGIRYLAIGLYQSTTNCAGAGFDLQDGVVTGTGTGGGTGYAATNATITPVGNGWYRCSAAVTSGTTAAVSVQLYNKDAAYTGGTLYSEIPGDGYSGIYIWGAQLEAGAFPTSYIPTVASTVTRNADAASMTGTNFSSWYNAGEGTLYAESPNQNGAKSLAGFGKGTFADTITFNVTNLIRSAGTTPILTLGTAVTSAVKLAAVIKANDFAASANGSAAVTSATNLTVAESATQFSIGASPGSATLNGTIKKIAYYPVRLSNANLQALTA